MKSIVVNISESDFIKYNFQTETVSLDEFIEKLRTQLSKPIEKKSKFENTPAFNMWKDHDDMEDVENYVNQLRKPRQQNVYG